MRSFVAIVSSRPGNPGPGTRRLRCLPDWRPTCLTSADGRAELAFTGAEEPRGAGPVRAGGKLTLIVGDDSEWEETRGDSCMAGAACVAWDPAAGSLRVLSSAVGLPPAFIYREPGAIAVASELRLLRAIAGSRMTVDPRGAVELFEVGFPLERRTLFAEVSLMPGGHSLRLGVGGEAELASSWEPPEPEAAEDPDRGIGLEIEAFRRAVRRLRLSNSLFSLTGGLDTRAILAVLAEEGMRLPACTLSGGRRLCLDARLAGELCRAYGLPHVVVGLGERFVGGLPGYVTRASRLSGGLAGLEQAHEVYFYEQLEVLGSRRLSGHLGNQLGRRHPERLSMRGADARVLHAGDPEGRGRRAGRALAGPGRGPLGADVGAVAAAVRGPVLLAGELQHRASLHDAAEPLRRPLPDRSVPEGASARGEAAAFRPSRARLRELAHRFVGPPRARSFQRRMIADAGGPAAELPINWGWRARGGFSPGGLGRGLLAFADSVASRTPALPEVARRGLRRLGADGAGEITEYRPWFDTVLREFVNDTLRSRPVREGELFDAAAVTRRLDEHYRGARSHYDTLVAALDLALAQKLCAAPSSPAAGEEEWS